MWCYQQNEGKTKYQEKVLLVREEDEFSAEIARIGADLLETYRELLQKNWGLEVKWGITQSTASPSPRDPQMCITEFPSSQTILIVC